MKLFETLDDLKPFIFRIVDNGGATADRFTIIFCDGDYFSSSSYPSHPQGVGLSGEGIDVQWASERVESGTERDLRWIDLPEPVQGCVMVMLNNGFSDWLSDFTPPKKRADVVDWGTAHRLSERPGEGVYGTPGAYYVRRETYPDDGTGADDLGPYLTIREAVLDTLPEDYDLSGPEYHPEIDIWDETDGPAPLWDCEAVGECN